MYKITYQLLLSDKTQTIICNEKRVKEILATIEKRGFKFFNLEKILA